MKLNFYKLLLLNLVLITNWSVTIGQIQTKSGFYATPKILLDYCKATDLDKIYSGEKLVKDLEQSPGNEWIVYSDRANNKVYHDPNGNVKSNVKLTFLQPLLVKEVQGEWLLVFKKTDVYSGEYEELGWIKCSNLILNSYALLNKNSIPRKAMALVSLDDAKVQLQKIDIEKFKLYSGPDNDNAKGEAKKFEIYYVFKEVKGKKLLARTDKLSGSQIALESNVAGWIANFHVTDWDSRLCLEISSKSELI
jgi:hypothetical protein